MANHSVTVSRADQLLQRLDQIRALTEVATGEGSESFAAFSEGIRNDYLRCIGDLAELAKVDAMAMAGYRDEAANVGDQAAN